MSSKFRFRNRFWFRETFIYASRSFTDDFLGNRFGFVCFDCPKDSSSQSVKPPVCAAETPAVIFLKKKNLNCDLAAAGPSSSVLQLWLELENQHRGTSYISSNKTDKPERMRWSCAFWFCGEREKKINAAWLNFKCRGDWGGGGGGGMLLRMWLYNERTIHRLQLEISWVS